MSRSASLERRLFTSRGMVAWMEAWSSVSDLSAVATSGDRVEGEANRQDPGLPVAVRVEVTDILAGITWTVLRS